MDGEQTELTQIERTKLLIGEGKDEVKFFYNLLIEMGTDINTLEIREVGGICQFRTKFPALTKTVGFDKVKTLAIIRDADDENPQAAFRSIINILKNLRFTNLPSNMGLWGKGDPKIGIFIMPDNLHKGMLEDLCLNAVNKNPAMKCVDSFFSCIESLPDSVLPRNMSKAKVQSYLAAMPDIVPSLGIGAEKGYWNFDSSIYNNLKKFLRYFLV